MKLLIISADDFGTSHTANETIERLFRAGKITTAGIVANATHASDAIFRALDCNMNAGIQWRMPAALDDADCTGVMFELEYQISFLTDQGLTPDHATNPGRTLMDYMGQNYMSEAFMVCGGHNIPFRMPQSTVKLIPAMSASVIEFMEAYYMMHRPMVECAWLYNVKLPKTVTNTRTDLKVESYEKLKSGCIKILSILPDGITVLHLNPCDESDESKGIYKDWQKRAWEAQLVEDPEFLAALDGFILADYTKAFDDDTYAEMSK